MRNKTVFLLLLVLFVSGCATTLRKSSLCDEAMYKIKTIAVMPPSIEVYKFTAGGVRELIDEWSDVSKTYVREALKEHLGKRFCYQVKFIEEDWLKQNYQELWLANEALYKAISNSVQLHAYPGPNTFSSKIKNFDYTMGSEIKSLADVLQADALLFVYGIDHEATAGRSALLVWNLLMGAATGVMVIPLNPSFMSVGLVDGQSGDVHWFKTSVAGTEYSFCNKGQVNTLVEWLTRDFQTKK